MTENTWQLALEEYVKQGEPGKTEKSEAWQTAIGLQAVDGLTTSEYLLDTAKKHIEGKISIDEAQKRIQSYYEQRTVRTEIEDATKEADTVSARIAMLLGEKSFQFSPAEWLTIHRRLFEGVFKHAGQIRQYNITKKEWVLPTSRWISFPATGSSFPHPPSPAMRRIFPRSSMSCSVRALMWSMKRAKAFMFPATPARKN